MKFGFSGEQEEFRSNLRRLFAERSPTTEVRRRMENLLLTPVANTPEQFRAVIETEIRQWRSVANAAGISAVSGHAPSTTTPAAP